MSKRKYTKEFKLKVLKEHEEGASFYSLEKKYGITLGTVKRWNSAFQARGEDFLTPQNSDLCWYTAEFKKEVVLDYLSGGGASQSIAVKYGIHAESTVLKWVKQYNSHEELTDSRKTGGYLMTKDIKRRKTTMEERIKIVEYCISHSNDYASVAKEFNCSYGQVYSWVKKYVTDGIEGLRDGRGRNKPEEELSEVEKLKAENRLLRAEKKQQMEIDLLKNSKKSREVTLRRTRHLDEYIAIKELSEEHDGYPVSEMCRILQVNRAAYYKWKNHGNGRNDALNELISRKAAQIHSEHPDMGYRRIRDTLAHDHGINVNDKRILRICRKKKYSPM